MKGKPTTIRKELTWSLIKGAGLASVCMLFMCMLMIIASLSRPFALFFNRHVFLFIILFLILFSVLTITFFIMLIRNRIEYLEAITKTLDTISGGDLEVDIPVISNDELGKMAHTVNTMAYKLKSSLEEERRLEQTKSELITNISHDLRTPLSSVLGYLELIIKTDFTREDELKRYANIAYNQCRDLKVLIEELFEFTKLSNSGIKPNKKHISVGELLEQVITGFIPVFDKCGMEYRLFFPNEKIYIEADPILIKRVFDNLIGNAINYGKEGKYLDIELSADTGTAVDTVVETAAETAVGTAVVRFVNYGDPIPDESLPRIFEKYYRVNMSGSCQTGSSGLGLAITKSIVELHGGSVNASNKDGRTVFEVRLPLPL